MDCPVCKTVKLVMSDRQGIEIDYCPNCRGVWLDRGELDKIIDRSVGIAPQPAPQPALQPQSRPAPPPVRNDQYREQSYQQPHGYPPHGQHKKKKREGFLSDLFDFD
jgi:Zn-finger nucleic acid-binding protein